MIFVTVGTQWPFDRLIRLMDDWAAANPGRDVFAQTWKNAYRPRHMRWEEQLAPARFREMCQAAEIIVAHAGIGAVMTALGLGKPIILMPRRFQLKEHLNDHQMETARALRGRAGIHIADTAEELYAAIGVGGAGLSAAITPPKASDLLLSTVRDFIEGRSP